MALKKKVSGKDLALSLGAGGLVVLLSFFSFYESTELKLLDLRFRLRGPIETRNEIATVDIDVQALQAEGRFQDWSRDKHARLINFGEDQQVSMLAFDIYFPEPSTPYIPLEALADLDTTHMDEKALRGLVKDNDEIMRQALLSADNVYLAQSFKPLDEDSSRIKTRSNRQHNALELLAPYYRQSELSPKSSLFSFFDIETPIDEFITAAKGIGYAQAKADNDGVIRRYPLVGVYDGRLFPSIVLLMVCDYYGVSFKEVEILPGEAIVLPKSDGGTLRIPISEEGFMMVNWAGDWTDDFTHYPYNLSVEFSENNSANFVLQSVKTILEKQPDLVASPAMFLSLMASKNVGSKTQIKNAFNKIALAKRVESGLENNPLLTGAEYFEAQGLPVDRIPEGMFHFYKEIKTNMLMEKALLIDGEVSFDSLVSSLEIDGGITNRWNFLILQNYIRAEGTTEGLHPLYFFPMESKFDLGGKLIAPFEFKNKMLFYGLTAAGTHDLNPMPYNARYPMVGLHANALNTILAQNFIRRTSRFVEILQILGIALIVALIISRLRPISGGAIIVVVWFGIAFTNLYLFSSRGIWMDFLGPSLAFIFSYVSLTIHNFMAEEKDKKFFHETFKAYLSPELIDQMFEDKSMPELGGVEGVRTAFFTDIQSFSTIAEEIGNPSQLVDLLNEYLSDMTDILLEHHGTLDKYEGDAIIAIFGAPIALEDHAEKACLTALSMQQSLGLLKQKWQADGDKWPDIVKTMQMRVGLNSGPIVTGNMGSSTRMNYTMIGDAVNIAARLESIAKQYGIFIAVSGDTIESVQNNSFATRLVDRIRVIGKQEPVELYELLGFAGELGEGLTDLCSIYKEAFELYTSRQWEKAATLFQKSSNLESSRLAFSEKISPSLLFLQRSNEYIKSPPGDDWDGVFTATSK